MVDSYKEYKRYIETEKPLYLANRSIIGILVMVFTHDGTYLTWKFLKSLRKCEFLKNTSRGVLKVFYWLLNDEERISLDYCWDLKYMRTALRKACFFIIEM